MSFLAGIDIGGTKCAVSIGQQEDGNVKILYKEKFPTLVHPGEAVQRMVDSLAYMLDAHPEIRLSAVGISCGSPLNSEKGLILSPPNLPGWDHIDIVSPFREKFGVPAALQNDANACALAEWLWGAGKGTKNMIFLTFGTGMGAGLILDGRLYVGTNDMAGEVGHMRLAEDGPAGYGKAGSFEGFCSGGGIARYAAGKIRKWKEEGKKASVLYQLREPEAVTAELVGMAAAEGDELGLSILHDTAEMLGRGLAILIDILNPEKIVIGSIFLRQEAVLRGKMEAIIRKEALSYNREVCTVVSAGLGEALGDYAALSVAGNLLRGRE